MNPRVRGFFDEATNTISYVMADPATGRCALIDPVWDYDPKSGRTRTTSADGMAGYVKDEGLTVELILETHAHADHLSASQHTLFMPDYGTARADFPGGDAATLFRSIRRVFELPDDTVLYLCHDYLPEGRSEYVWQTTVADERRSNVHVHDGVTEAEYVKMREARDRTLDMPTLLLPSVQVNIRAGRVPPPEGNGVSYLKIPVDAL